MKRRRDPEPEPASTVGRCVRTADAYSPLSTLAVDLAIAEMTGIEVADLTGYVVVAIGTRRPDGVEPFSVLPSRRGDWQWAVDTIEHTAAAMRRAAAADEC